MWRKAFVLWDVDNSGDVDRVELKQVIVMHWLVYICLCGCVRACVCVCMCICVYVCTYVLTDRPTDRPIDRLID